MVVRAVDATVGGHRCLGGVVESGAVVSTVVGIAAWLVLG